MDYLQTEFSNLIASLSEEHFNHLIKEFNKEYYESNDVRIVNGPYDGGIDMEVYMNEEVIKRAIQITVQKTNLENKLKKDLSKAKENAKNFDYQKTLDFYCTISLTGDTKRVWKRMALKDYAIDLKLYDGNALAALAEMFPSIKETLFEIFGVDKHHELIHVDKHTKVLYDMFAIGKDAGELKRQFLHSLIIIYVFEHVNCSEEEVFNGLKNSLQDNPQASLIIKSNIDSLRAKGVIINGAQKYQMELAADKRAEIQELLNTSIAQEGVLKIELQDCLSKYHLVPDTKKIVDFIYKSFQANYDADLEELSGNSKHEGSAIKKIYAALIKFLTERIKDSAASTKAAREILDICTCNDYLKKISASILFTKLFQSDKLESYINQKKQFLFLDTQILLRIICLDVERKNMPDSIMRSVIDFYETVTKFKSRIFLQTSHEYINELTKQIVDALKLDRFFSLPIIQKMGATTNNVIYNYYKILKDNRLYDSQLSIYDFVSDILGTNPLPNINSQEFIPIVSNKIEKIFGFMDIEIKSIPYNEEFLGIKREYEHSLHEKTKTARAIENDIKTIMYLSDPYVHKDDKANIMNEPFLITWDKTFFNARKMILKKYTNRTYWYIYTPAKFADRLSLQNFQLNPTAINNNIVSLTESSFNVSSTTTFVDLMSSIFNTQDLTNVKIAHKLIELEHMNKPLVEDPHNEDIQEETPVIRVLTELRSHYFKKENKFNNDDLVVTLENNILADEIYHIIFKNVESWKSSKKLMKDLFSEFDELIAQNIVKTDNKSDTLGKENEE